MNDMEFIEKYLGNTKDDGLARYRRNGEKWEEIREMVRMRDNFTCQDCGKVQDPMGRALDVHHMKPFLDSENNSMENLITLCRSCHKKADEVLEKEKKKNG